MQCTVRWLELDHQPSHQPGSLSHRLELASPRSLIGPHWEYWPVIGQYRAQAAVTGTRLAAAQIYGSLQVAELRQWPDPRHTVTTRTRG